MEVRYPLILDGATGTQLQKRGFDGSVRAEDWVLTHPEVISEIQNAYVTAGSRVVYAPTFEANGLKMPPEEVADYNAKLVAVSRNAVGDRAFVAGDMAPTGKFLAPLGEESFEDLVWAYTLQAQALEQAGVDLFVIETMMTLSDARAAVLAVKSVSKKPVFVTFTCDEKGRTLTGTDVTAALVVLQGMGVDAFGLNCSAGPDQMLEQLKRLKEYAHVPLIAKPNAGLPRTVEGKTVYNCPPEAFTAYVRDMAECGVCLFGGCCGTEVDHIAALAKAAANLDCACPVPERTDLLPCATGKDVFLLPVTAGYSAVLPCDDELEDALCDCDEDEGEMTAIRIETADELEIFAECQGMVTKPLCLLCEDGELLEKTLRLYQGRAVYEGGLPDDVLMPLVEKYGLIL